MVIVCVKDFVLFHLQIINESIDSGFYGIPNAGRCSFLFVGCMAWFKVDDGFIEHQKVIRLASEYPREYADCLCLWLELCVYSCRNYTDGFVDKIVLKDASRRHIGKPSRLRKVTEALLTVGLLDSDKDGYRIHDFLEYNVSSTQKQKKNEQQKESMRKLREKRVTGHIEVSDSCPEPEPEPQKEIDKEKGNEITLTPYWREADKLTPTQCAVAYTELTCRTYDYQTHKKAFDSIANNVSRYHNSPKLLERCLAKWLEGRSSNKWKPTWFASDLSDLIADMQEDK